MEGARVNIVNTNNISKVFTMSLGVLASPTSMPILGISKALGWA